MRLADESTHRRLVESIDLPVYTLDLDGRVVSWHGGAARCLGYREGDILGQAFESLYAEEDRQAGRPAEALRQASDIGRYESKHIWMRKDGSPVPVHVLVNPITTDAGTMTGYAVVGRDLSSEYIEDEISYRHEQQFRLLVKGVEDYAIYMLDTQGRVSSWNAGAQRIKGYTEAEIIGRHFSTFYPPDDRAAGEPEHGLSIARATGRFENEAQRIRKDGTTFWAHVVIDRILDEQGVHVGYAKITRDITDKRVAEEALALARESLFQSQKMEAIGQLTGGMAHDFNNLLMAVLASLELLEKHVSKDGLALLQNAIAGAQRGAALTQRMLAFARRQELRPSAVDIKALMQNIGDLMQRSVGPQISIETRFPLLLMPVLVDENQLELALLNLAMNARDAMPGGGRLIIGAHPHAVDEGHRMRLPVGNYLCISITDEGSGMDEVTLVRATEPFFTTKGIGKGTGLGLSMVHGLAEQSGGRLKLQSVPGQGTTAELWLPLTVAPPVTAVAEKASAPATAAYDGPAWHILVVDDDELVRMTMTSLLEDAGHRVIETSNGNDALQILQRENSIDLVITDHAMPGMTGVQLTEAIQAAWPKLPVILATGYVELAEGEHIDIQRLTKPYGRVELLKAIRQAMVRANRVVIS